MFKINRNSCFSSSVGRAQGWKPWGRWFESSLEHMNLNYKLYFKYILFNTNQIFIKNWLKNNKSLIIYINENNLYYLTLHLKLSSLFYSTQLIEIFAYDYPYNINTEKKNNAKITTLNNSLIVYNFHSITNQQRFFIFSLNNLKKNLNKKSINWLSLNSITELFLNANWLEREAAELNAISFSNKKDLRNLMLQYGDTSAPLKKPFPSIGLREIFYDSSNDLLIQVPVTIQF